MQGLRHPMNENGSISLLTFELYLSGCMSLKEKRSIIQPILARLHKEFNISISEIAYQDRWEMARLGCVVVSNDGRYNQKILAEVLNYLSAHFLKVEVIQSQIESR